MSVNYFWFAKYGGEPWVRLLFCTFSLNSETGRFGEQIDGKAYAYGAVIMNYLDVQQTIQNVVSSPVQLTVGWDTTLTLRVWDGSSPIRYTVGGWLMSGGVELQDRVVVTTLAVCVYAAFTDAGGYFNYERDLQQNGTSNKLTSKHADEENGINQL